MHLTDRGARRLRTLAVLLAALLSVGATGAAQAPATRPPEITFTCEPASGFTSKGQTVTWRFSGAADGTTFRVRRNNLDVIQEGRLGEDGTVRASLPEAGWLLVEIVRDGKVVRTAGAVVARDELRGAMPAPPDFDAFWQGEIAAQAKLPLNPKVSPGPAGRGNVEYSEVTLDNIAGKHVRAQVARPTSGGKHPAVVIFQWAGVYGLDKSIVTAPAAGGWLAMNVMAHDLPLHEPKAFYDAQGAGALKEYLWIGAESREASYFRPMLVGDYRALEYVTSLPEWDGKTLVVRGVSQGGMQAIALAGLHPRVTAAIAGVPAGADTMGKTAGRLPGWPYWYKAHEAPTPAPEVMAASRYFDIVSFAPKVRCPTLVGFGLRDTTSPPPGVLAMFNGLGGEKEGVPTVDAGHPDPQKAFDARAGLWLASLLKTGQPPQIK